MKVKPRIISKDDPRISEYLGRAISMEISTGISTDILLLLLNGKFSVEQEAMILDAVYIGIPISILKHYATREVSPEQMQEFNDIFNDMKDFDNVNLDDISEEDINFIFSKELNISQSLAICVAYFDNHLDKDIIKRYAGGKFNGSQMDSIYTGFAYGLTMEEVDKYMDPKLPGTEMLLAIDWILRQRDK